MIKLCALYIALQYTETPFWIIIGQCYTDPIYNHINFDTYPIFGLNFKQSPWIRSNDEKLRAWWSVLVYTDLLFAVFLEATGSIWNEEKINFIW